MGGGAAAAQGETEGGEGERRVYGVARTRYAPIRRTGGEAAEKERRERTPRSGGRREV